MKTYAIRGAVTAKTNTASCIIDATKKMLKEIIDVNSLTNEELISMFFTTTQDLNTAFPAKAAREMGITNVALMCAHEMNVSGALPMCIRVMIHVNKKEPFIPKYVYLEDAKKLRPDLFS